MLHVSVWDGEPSGTAADYLGETSVELSTNPLDDEPEWHFLSWEVSEQNETIYK